MSLVEIGINVCGREGQPHREAHTERDRFDFTTWLPNDQPIRETSSREGPSGAAAVLTSLEVDACTSPKPANGFKRQSATHTAYLLERACVRYTSPRALTDRNATPGRREPIFSSSIALSTHVHACPTAAGACSINVTKQTMRCSFGRQMNCNPDMIVGSAATPHNSKGRTWMVSLSGSCSAAVGFLNNNSRGRQTTRRQP